MLHLFDYSKIVKYHYNKKKKIIPVMAKFDFQLHYSSLQCQWSVKKHSNIVMLGS